MRPDIVRSGRCFSVRRLRRATRNRLFCCAPTLGTPTTAKCTTDAAFRRGIREGVRPRAHLQFRASAEAQAALLRPHRASARDTDTSWGIHRRKARITGPAPCVFSRTRHPPDRRKGLLAMGSKDLCALDTAAKAARQATNGTGPAPCVAGAQSATRHATSTPAALGASTQTRARQLAPKVRLHTFERRERPIATRVVDPPPEDAPCMQSMAHRPSVRDAQQRASDPKPSSRRQVFSRKCPDMHSSQYSPSSRHRVEHRQCGAPGCSPASGASVKMPAALQRAMMAEIMKLPRCCRKVARHTITPRLTWRAPKLSSDCRKVAQSCPQVAPRAKVWP